jgi:hypothetical protein
MGRAKNFIGRTVEEAAPFFGRTAQENVVESLARATDLPRGALLEGPVEGSPRTIRQMLEQIGQGEEAIAQSRPLSDVLPAEDELNNILSNMTRQMDVPGMSAPPVTSLGPMGGEIGSMTVDIPESVMARGKESALGFTFPDVDEAGKTMLNIATQVDPVTLRLQHLAEHPRSQALGRSMGKLVEHETQHAVNKFLGPQVFMDLFKNPDAMAFFDNILTSKYGKAGSKAYREKGISHWIDEALAVAIETNVHGAIPHEQLAKELTELKEVYSAVDPLQKQRRAAGLIGR